MKSWQLQELKVHFSKIVKEAIIHGPQEIILSGELAIVVLSKQEYGKLKKPKSSFIQFMRQSPLVGSKLKLTRNSSKTGNAEL